MAKHLSVGTVFTSTVATASEAARELPPDSPFRILILANFSGRPKREFGRPISIDRDNFDDVLAKISPRLSLNGINPDGSPVEIGFGELDDFHPDRIYNRIELFDTLRTTRARLQNPATFAAAAETLRGWGTSASQPAATATSTPQETRSETPTGDLLDAFLDNAVKASALPERQANAFQQFVDKIVGPHRVAADDPSKEEFVELVDALVAEGMRAILHHPEFQSIERAWRSLNLLTRRLETGVDLKISILDCSKQNLAHDLDSVENLAQSAFYRLLVDLPSDAPPWTLLIGDYSFAATQTDVEMLARIAQIAARAGAPFVAGAESTVVGCASFAEAIDSDDWQPLDPAAAGMWQSLRQFAPATSLGLTAPRFLLRSPYGRESNEVENFAFEEQPKHENYLWGNGAFVVACLLGQTFSETGWQMDGRLLRDLEDLPIYLFDDDGESRVKPCAELLLTQRAAEQILESGVMALQSFQDRGTVRLLRLQSLAEPTAALAGRWS